MRKPDKKIVAILKGVQDLERNINDRLADLTSRTHKLETLSEDIHLQMAEFRKGKSEAEAKMIDLDCRIHDLDGAVDKTESWLVMTDEQIKRIFKSIKKTCIKKGYSFLNVFGCQDYEPEKDCHGNPKTARMY